MSTSVNVAVAIEAGLAFHEAFRRLGYPPGAIFVAVAPADEHGGGLGIFMVLRSPLLQGGQVQIHLTPMGPITEAEREEFYREWPKAAVDWNTTMTPEQRSALWRESYVANNCVEFTLMMVRKGHREPISKGVFA